MPDQHVASDSDCIASIAFHYGFFPDTVWNHAGNAALRQQRNNPNVLSPGDVVIIPDKRRKEITRPDHARHRFRRKGVPE